MVNRITVVLPLIHIRYHNLRGEVCTYYMLVGELGFDWGGEPLNELEWIAIFGGNVGCRVSLDSLCVMCEAHSSSTSRWEVSGEWSDEIDE